MQRLSSPNGGADRGGTFSPDGDAVAFSHCVHGFVCEINVLEVSEQLRAEGEPRRITFLQNTVAGAPAWTADGRALIFISGSPHNPSLWKVAVSRPGWKPGNPERLAFAGYGVGTPAVSRQGRFAYALSPVGVDIWRLELDASRPGTPAGGHGKPPLKLISSTRAEHAPEYSPDGQRIAFGSDRSGNHEIWVANSDGSNAMKLTSFDGPYTADPHWSPDGRWIAFGSRLAGNGDVYVISSDGGKPKRLTSNASDDGPNAWSRDGKWIYFGSNRTGEDQVWKARAEGGGEVQVTRNRGGGGPLSPDGKLLYYMKDDGIDSALWRVPAEGGEETQVLESVCCSNVAVVEQGIYFIPRLSEPVVQFFDFATKKVVTIARLQRTAAYGLDVSPDGRWLLYSEYEPRQGDLMLVENFK
jgi:Tol biopolymer transport system component